MRIKGRGHRDRLVTDLTASTSICTNCKPQIHHQRLSLAHGFILERSNN
jgi:hypothetical protein